MEYGVDPASVVLAPPEAAAPTVGSVVLREGVRFKVQYVTSKGMLDLKAEDAGGDVEYGVDPASVTVVANAALEAGGHIAQHDPSGLIGTVVTIWEDGCGQAATVVELDHTSGRNRLRVRYVRDDPEQDEWVERWRLKQGKRVEAVADVTARWEADCQQARALDPEMASHRGRRRSARSVAFGPLPVDGSNGAEGRKVPEWRQGERPKPPSASTVEQRDGSWVTVDKYPEAIARSFSRATKMEEAASEAVRRRARCVDGLAAGAAGASPEVSATLTRWMYACAIRGVASAEPDGWLEPVSEVMLTGRW